MCFVLCMHACCILIHLFVESLCQLMCVHVTRAEWIEEHSSAAAPLANYAPNHLETYRDTQVPPTLPPGPAGPKSKYFSCVPVLRLDFSVRCSWQTHHALQIKM